MKTPLRSSSETSKRLFVSDFKAFSRHVDYSFMDKLKADPEARDDGVDHQARQVYSGHFVPVTPSPIADPEYVSHSKVFFKELGLSDDLAHTDSFTRAFSGDLSMAEAPMRKYGWATGYALSIYGTEYTSQCPFQTGNGYGDGRAISVFEGEFFGKRWEMQLKGGGPTPYCRGGDGRAVLRSSVREFLAQDHMHALGVPTSRSLTLYTSKSETVDRPWYSEGSYSSDPDIMTSNPVAISTRVAPSFLRVGQLELFARRVRDKAHAKAFEELKAIVEHLIEREYQNEIDQDLPFEKQLVLLAKLFGGRLSRLVANWIRVGYCQGNFNSDNCAAGGFTLDYGPFGFCESFDPEFQPWTGGGQHFSFLNQPNAAFANFHMFCRALRPLLVEGSHELSELEQILKGFADVMQIDLEKIWASKLGLRSFDAELFSELVGLMVASKVDFTILFRELSSVPEDALSLKKSFYVDSTRERDEKWQAWLSRWRDKVLTDSENDIGSVSVKMKQINPKYIWREWLVVPAYKQASKGDYSLVRELQEVLGAPYDEQTDRVDAKYYQLKPKEFFNAGGVSQYSCSS